MGKSTVRALLMEVVRAINAILLRRVIRLGDLDLIVTRFATQSFPNHSGAIDGTHIPIRTPGHRAAPIHQQEGLLFDGAAGPIRPPWTVRGHFCQVVGQGA